MGLRAAQGAMDPFKLGQKAACSSGSSGQAFCCGSPVNKLPHMYVGNQISIYFGLLHPTINEYLNNSS